VSLLVQLLLPLLAFAVGTGFGLAVGLDGLGQAATVGQLAFAAVLVAVLVRLSPGRS
jgi:hypothetical protein